MARQVAPNAALIFSWLGLNSATVRRQARFLRLTQGSIAGGKALMTGVEAKLILPSLWKSYGYWLAAIRVAVSDYPCAFPA